MKALFLLLVAGFIFTAKAEEVEIRPSVWGTEKWYGGYEVYSKDNKIGEIRPSVWGTEKWYGGYEVYSGDKKIGEIRPSVWGAKEWPGGYELYQGDRLVGEAKASVWVRTSGTEATRWRPKSGRGPSFSKSFSRKSNSLKQFLYFFVGISIRKTGVR